MQKYCFFLKPQNILTKKCCFFLKLSYRTKKTAEFLPFFLVELKKNRTFAGVLHLLLKYQHTILMKINSIIASAMLFLVTAFAACDNVPPFIPNGPGPGIDIPVVKDSTDLLPPDTIGWNIPAEAITVAQAREICAGLESGATSGTKYYVMGYVKKLHSKHEDGVTNYGNAQFYIEDVKNANSSNDFMAFQVYGPGGKRITDPNVVAVGDFVVIYGEVTNYNGTYETVGKGAAQIWKSTNPLFNGSSTPDEPEILVIPEEAKAWGIPAEAIDVIKAREICASLASGATSGTKYYVMGYVKGLHNNHTTGVEQYGNAQFFMENVKGKKSQNDFIAFQVYGINGTKITDSNAVKEGDFVVVYGELTNYMGNTYETVGKGAAHIWKSTNPLLVESEPETPLTGAGTEANPYTIDDVIQLNNSKSGEFFVKAYIVGQVNGTSTSNAEFDAPFSPAVNKKTGKPYSYNTNLLVAASPTETDAAKCVAVHLPAGDLRDGLNLPENPDMDGTEILIYGSLEEYLGTWGIRNPTYAVAGDKVMGSK